MNALRIAEQLDAVPENGADPYLIQEAAAELRRLHAEDHGCLLRRGRMNCPDCGLSTQVVETKTEGQIILRRRRCPNNHMVYTQERVIYSKERSEQNVPKMHRT